MPLYEYQCTKCDNHFERIQKFSDPIVTECSLCGGKVERVMSIPAIHFKGSGWYVTDYANKNAASKSTGKGDDKSNASSTEAKGASKTESKTENKSSSSESKPAEKK